MMVAIVAIIGIVSLTAAVIFGEKPVVSEIQPDPAFICLFVVLILIPWIIVAMKIFHIKLGSPKYENNNRSRTKLAEQIGVSQPFLSMIITGRRIGAKEKGKLARQVIAESLGMAVEDLWPKRAA